MNKRRLIQIVTLLSMAVALCAWTFRQNHQLSDQGEAAKKETAKAEKTEFTKEQIEAAEKAETKDLIFKSLNFLIMFGAIVYFLRKPASEFFQTRTATIQKDMVEARAAREKAEQRLATIQQQLDHLNDEIAVLRAEAGREDAAQAERMKQATANEAAKILAQAESEIDTLSRAARLDLKVYAAKLAVDLAEERIKGEMNADAQGRLLHNYVANLSDGGKN